MAEQLKNMFFTSDSLSEFADILLKNHPEFAKDTFLAAFTVPEWKSLELKEKMRFTTEVLRPLLPDSYEKAVSILEQAAPYVKGFEAITLPDFVEVYGMDEWDLSMHALRVFTRYSSSEFAIRPFLRCDLEKAMTFMYSCAEDEHENVRRFASEGCRPRLPWATAVPALKKDPSLILPILDMLKDDPSEFVRRSVANNLNDISKDHPETVLGLAEKWIGKTENTDKLVKHALRTLLKQGNTRAMRLFGFADPEHLTIHALHCDKKTVSMGDTVEFSFELNVEEKTPVKVRLEYAIHFMKAKGKVSKKVFQLSEKDFEPGTHALARKYTFVDMTTRKHYPGEHAVSIVVNGVEKSKCTFVVAG